MYYPLYVANKWVDPLDRYLADPTLTDPAWFKYDDILKAWRDADSIDGKPYGIPYDGEVTVQVYRKDLYEGQGLKPAETFDELIANAKALNDPANRIHGLALRGFAGAGQNMYIYPSLLRAFGGTWFSGSSITVNSPEAVRALQWYVDALTQYAPPAVRNWNWPDIADAFLARNRRLLHRRAFLGRRPEQSGQVQGHRQGRLRPVAHGACGEARDLDLELGLSDQCSAQRAGQESHLALHRLGRVAETQARTSWKFAGAAKRSGVNRTSLWRAPSSSGHEGFRRQLREGRP
jgi:hypothetical protein